VLAGRARDIGRAVSAMEREGGSPEILAALYPKTGGARIVGITGPPGAGKSTLVQRLAQALRKAGKTVGIVAVDPSSPFTGGAILGDRIRMTEIYTDPGVFIRSMATRGALGGLARATSDAVDVLDAAGFDVVLIETVGVGQDEVDIVRVADTTAVVLVPGLGDDIQAIKAGLLEIADVFVVNKADREGADRAAAELAMMLDLTGERPWRPPIVRTVAPRNEGVAEALAALDAHAAHLAATGEGALRRRQRARSRLLALLEERFRRAVEARAPEPDGLEEAIRRVLEHREDPYAAAGRLFERLVREPVETGERRTMIAYKIDHLGVAVASLEEALGVYRALGLAQTHSEEVGSQGVRTAFLPVGESSIELLEPMSPDSPVGKFLGKRGPGIHHVCFAVHDLEAALAELAAKGFRLIHRAPVPGAGGKRVAFLHPEAGHGVLIELAEKRGR
jgi:LAO/AO transport system kinase